MTNDDKQSAGRPPSTGRLAVRNPGALVFAAEMYALQLDQLAARTGGERSARAAASRWRTLGYAETAQLSPGAPWLWVTRAGLDACGLEYRPAKPALARLAHIRAVAAARIALEATDGYQAASAFWRCERRIRSRHGVGVRQHLPDAEVHWPDGARGRDGTPIGWAGECWAIEAEISPKTVARTTAIMREILFRTGDYGCLAADVAVPGRRPGTRGRSTCAPRRRCRPCCAPAPPSARSPPGSRSATSRRARSCKRARSHRPPRTTGGRPRSRRGCRGIVGDAGGLLRDVCIRFPGRLSRNNFGWQHFLLLSIPIRGRRLLCVLPIIFRWVFDTR